jgi:uncharacterized membrane protein
LNLMIFRRRIWLSLSILPILFTNMNNSAFARVESQTGEMPVVRAVMFWMDTCGHCHYVLENVLPPLQAKYGEQFELALIELVSSEDVDRLYRTASEYGIPENQVGVPFLIIGEEVLYGSDQVENQLPGLIERYLAQGGVDYPQVAGLGDVPPTSQAGAAAFDTIGEQVGLVLANIILLGMVVALAYTAIVFVQGKSRKVKKKRTRSSWRDLAIPVLAILGLGVAGYLAYVETQAVPAVCGPLGDCNAVQTSPYARLFGVLPVGVLGVIGYLAILGAWIIRRFGNGQVAGYASLILFSVALFGTLFSIYLTYLEPYVIEAVCVWCLTSAVVITLLTLLSVKTAREALVEIV